MSRKSNQRRRIANRDDLIPPPTPLWDLYLVYEGKNPETGLPIIKAFLNPLIMWIWIGVGIVVFGTGVALVPNMTAALASQKNRVPLAAAVPAEAALKGGD